MKYGFYIVKQVVLQIRQAGMSDKSDHDAICLGRAGIPGDPGGTADRFVSWFREQRDRDRI